MPAAFDGLTRVHSQNIKKIVLDAFENSIGNHNLIKSLVTPSVRSSIFHGYEHSISGLRKLFNDLVDWREVDLIGEQINYSAFAASCPAGAGYFGIAGYTTIQNLVAVYGDEALRHIFLGKGSRKDDDQYFHFSTLGVPTTEITVHINQENKAELIRWFPGQDMQQVLQLSLGDNIVRCNWRLPIRNKS